MFYKYFSALLIEIVFLPVPDTHELFNLETNVVFFIWKIKFQYHLLTNTAFTHYPAVPSDHNSSFKFSYQQETPLDSMYLCVGEYWYHLIDSRF
jgi:hypothetical protein